MSSLVYFLFFLSGWTGLVYEVLWARYLALSLGGAALAQTFVLAAFLGGLAAGYAALGRRADFSPSPVRLYAWLELGIGVLGLAAPALLSSSWGLPLVPLSAFLMGGTLPALSRFATADPAVVASSVSRLYYLNSLGAAAGAASAAFVLIPSFGFDASSVIVSAVNLGVAGAAFGLARRLPNRPPAKAELKVLSLPAGELPPAGVYAAVFVAGLVSLTYETAWVRLLTLLVGSSAYSFAVMLSAFIAGIGTGGWLVARGWHPRWPAPRLLAAALFGAALMLVLILPLYERLSFLTFQLDLSFSRSAKNFALFEACKFLFCFAVMLPPAAFLGMTLPFAARAAVSSGKELGLRVGLVFGFNTLGNVLGAAAAGLWLLPALGLQRLFTLGIALQLAVAAWLWAADRALPRRGWLAGACAALLALHLATPAWDSLRLSFGVYRHAIPAGVDFATYQTVFKHYRLAYYKDDREATVSVVGFNSGALALKVNGKTDASSDKDLRTQILLAQLPLLLNPGAREALIVGLGSGMTAGSALLHELERLDVVELTPAVISAARLFAGHNHRVLENPRLRLHTGDGRAFLQRTPRRYDVIVSEPSNPWIAGVGNLFTQEFYRTALSRLEPGGLMAQWFHFYEMDDETMRLVLRSFLSVFPEATLWYTFSGDVVLLGGAEPKTPDFAALEAAFERPVLREELDRAGIDRPAALLALQIASDAGLRRMAGEGPVNRDRFPRLESQAPRAFFLRKQSNLVFNQDDNLAPERASRLLLRRFLAARGRGLSREDYAAILDYHGDYRSPFTLQLAREYGRDFPDDLEARLSGVRLMRNAGNLDGASASLSGWLDRRPRDKKALDLAADIELLRYTEKGVAEAGDRALVYLERLLPLAADDPIPALQRLARIHRRRGDYAKAVAALIAAARHASRGKDPEADRRWMEVADLAMDQEDAKTVLDALERALAHNPANRDARELLDILLKDPEPEPSVPSAG